MKKYRLPGWAQHSQEDFGYIRQNNVAWRVGV